MIFRPSSRRAPRRGSIAAQVAIVLTVLLGVAALAFDAGILMIERRQAQAAADAAALAGAYELLNDSTAISAAKTAATNVGNANYTSYSDTTPLTVTPNIPPTKGTFSDTTKYPSGYIEVNVQWNQKRIFSTIYGSGDLTISARAVARGLIVPNTAGILVLNKTGSGVLSANGNGNITVKNAPIVVNSTSASAITTSGKNAVITDASPGQPILVGGNPGYSGGGVSPTPTPSQTPTADPLATLQAPGVPALAPNPSTSGGVTTYQPGYYPSGISLTGGYTAVFQPGLYYMNGLFRVNGNPSSSLNGSGVTIFANSNASINIGGNGLVTLSAPTTGTYQGLVVYQDRTSSTALTIAGNGNFNITGTIYSPAATVNISGNGDLSVGGQFIADQLHNLGGGNSGQVNIVYNTNQVAKARVLNLVE